MSHLLLGFALLGLPGVDLDETPPEPEKPLLPNPDHHVRLAARYLALTNKYDRPYIRFVSLYAVPEDTISDWHRLLNWWLNNMSFRLAPAILKVVPGSDNRLLALDLRSYDWNAGGWQAVAHRDRVFREPLCPNKETEYLRREIGLLQDQKTFHAEAIIPGPFLFRDTIETDRSTSYYDLLFCKFRFKRGKVKQKRIIVQVVQEQEPYKVKQQVYDPYQRTYVTVETVAYKTLEKTKEVVKEVEVDGFIFTDFPKDKADWDKAFGFDEVNEFFKRQDVKVVQGSIVAGMTEDVRKGSVVARNNRLLTFNNGPLGPNFQSFDVEKATGKKDYLQQAPNLSRGLIEFDAQELLAGLPNGGQAAMLINAAKKRIEFAANKVATDGDPLDRRVRTPGSCVICHAPSNGLIPPDNLVKDALDVGVDFRIKNRRDYDDFLGFYLALKRRIRGYQDGYSGLLEDTTRLDPLDPKSPSWTGKEMAAVFEARRKDYDEPVTVERAAVEMGLPVAFLKGVSIQLGLSVRAQMFVRGQPCPRPTFDEDIFPELAKKLIEDRQRLFPPKVTLPKR